MNCRNESLHKLSLFKFSSIVGMHQDVCIDAMMSRIQTRCSTGSSLSKTVTLATCIKDDLTRKMGTGSTSDALEDNRSLKAEATVEKENTRFRNASLSALQRNDTNAVMNQKP